MQRETENVLAEFFPVLDQEVFDLILKNMEQQKGLSSFQSLLGQMIEFLRKKEKEGIWDQFDFHSLIKKASSLLDS